MSELEEQQKKILANVRKDTNNLEKQRQCVIKELEKVSIISVQASFNQMNRFFLRKIGKKCYNVIETFLLFLGKNKIM